MGGGVFTVFPHYVYKGVLNTTNLTAKLPIYCQNFHSFVTFFYGKASQKTDQCFSERAGGPSCEGITGGENKILV